MKTQESDVEVKVCSLIESKKQPVIFFSWISSKRASLYLSQTEKTLKLLSPSLLLPVHLSVYITGFSIFSLAKSCQLVAG